MNGKKDPAVLPLEIEFLEDSYTSESVTIASNSGYNAEWTVAKKAGYTLFAIVGFQSAIMSRLYRMDFEIGEENDTLLIGIKNTSPSSSTTVQVVLHLLYLKE